LSLVELPTLPPERTQTIGERGKRNWIYHDVVRGRFVKARDWVAAGLILFYIATPWLRIGGQPLLQFDLPARRFHIFGATFVATDAYLLALFLLISMLALFLFSALLGRLWCGWACPQTVYLDGVYRRIERWVEGTPRERTKLDAGPRNDSYYQKKVVKHALFLVVTVILSLTFTGYFIGGRASFALLTAPGAHGVAFIIAVVTTALLYFNFARFREQFCIFLCPYARLQSVLLDQHSLIIGYDPQRGEQRGPIRLRKETTETFGDCIDCKRCVQVCPTGIDIRDGLQLECISCAACIDACDMVMGKIGKPKGLIRYDSLAGLHGEEHRVIRPRAILYFVILTLLTILLAVKLSGREAIEFAVVRPPGTPYLVQEDRMVRNMFQIHLTNVDAEAHALNLKILGPEGLIYLIPGSPFAVKSGERLKAEAFVMFPDSLIQQATTEINFILFKDDEQIAEKAARFLGPIYHEQESKHNDDDDDDDAEH
jgi:cytochrome c oxidase accessory protein FixG